jgi:uncharacterized protein involved in oxidation of intracellular sulfur
MKLGIIISTNEPESVFNAFRLGVFSQKAGDETKVFLLGKGVESEIIESTKFNVSEQIKAFVSAGGIIFSCGSCLKIRNSEGSEVCPISTMKDLHQIIKESEKVICL